MKAFERVADLIIDHPKQMLLIWILALIVASVPASTVITDPQSVLSYDMTDMGGMEDSESVKGMNIIGDPDIFYQLPISMDLVTIVEIPDAATLTSVKSNTAGTFLNTMNVNLSETYGADNAEALFGAYYNHNGTTDETVFPGIGIVAYLFNDDTIVVANQTKAIRDVVSETKTETGMNLTTYVTGSAAIGADTMDSSMEDVKRIDPFSILLILVLIGLFFRSIITAATPPMTIGVAYVLCMAALFLIANMMDVYYITSTIVLVAMLGAGCDYCIFIIARYREERKLGLDHHDALREAVIWAGESITISGCSVIIGFGVMSICSFSMVSTMGMVMAVGVIFALLAALTLIPTILNYVGDRIFTPTKVEDYMEGSKVMGGWYGKCSRLGQRYFHSSSRASIKHAVPIVAVALLFTAPMAYVALTEQSSYDMISIMADGEAKEGVDVMVEYADGGILMPTYVVLETTEPVATLTDSGIPVPFSGQPLTLYYLDWEPTLTPMVYMAMVNILAVAIQEENSNIIDEGDVSTIIAWNMLVEMQTGDDQAAKEAAAIDVIRQRNGGAAQLIDFILNSPTSPIPSADRSRAIDGLLNYSFGSISSIQTHADGSEYQYIKLEVIMNDEPMSLESMNAIANIEKLIDETVKDSVDVLEPDEGPLFAAGYTTGSVAVMYEISEIVNGEFKYIELLVMVLIFLLLFFVMKSYLTPLRAIFTIIMSIAWTLALTHIIFDWIFGIPVTWIVPIILFVICLGLGMDYDILLTTRIKEYVSKGMSNDDAIVLAVEKSGAVITICGLIMGGAFLTMTLSTTPMLQEFGFALGFAILVDALVVRTYIVPAMMHLLGRWNWVGPKFLKPLSEVRKKDE